jgi:pyrimidine-nucleoside phosphorylase
MKGLNVAADTRELSLRLAGLMLWLGGAVDDEKAGYALAEKILSSGQAYEKFEELCQLHSGNLSALPRPKNRIDVFAKEAGTITAMNTEAIGIVGIKIKAGRAKTEDIIEPTAGIEFHKKVGDDIAAGEILFSLYGADKSLLESVREELLDTTTISLQKIPRPSLILKTLM